MRNTDTAFLQWALSLERVPSLLPLVVGAFLMLSPCLAGGQQAWHGNSWKGSRNGCLQDSSTSTPTCGLEMTCTDSELQVGYSAGICFRATCAGVWAMTHQRIDQASFRRRAITYRHYSFDGSWQLKDQGSFLSYEDALRELFLVLPGDLIEFRLMDPDCNARVNVKNLGYVKRGTVEELKQWLACKMYMDRIQVDANSQPYGGAYGDAHWKK